MNSMPPTVPPTEPPTEPPCPDDMIKIEFILYDEIMIMLNSEPNMTIVKLVERLNSDDGLLKGDDLITGNCGLEGQRIIDKVRDDICGLLLDIEKDTDNSDFDLKQWVCKRQAMCIHQMIKNTNDLMFVVSDIMLKDGIDVDGNGAICLITLDKGTVVCG